MSRRIRSRALVVALQVGILVALIGLWEVASRNRWIDPFFFSRPSDIWAATVRWAREGTIAKNLGITLYECVASFVLGVAGGLVVGFLLGRSDFWSRVFNPYIQVLNAIPRLILTPIFILIFGLGANSKIGLGVSLVFFIVFFNAYTGVREVDRNVLNNARLLGASRWQLTWHVYLPSAMSWILTSLHTSVGFAIAGAVVGEYIGSSQGIGYLISEASGNFHADQVYAGMLVLGVLVIVVEVGVTWLERSLVRWKPAAAGEGSVA